MNSIYVDLDGVVANFKAHYHAVTGYDFNSVPDTKTRWNMLEQHRVGFYKDIPPYIGFRDFMSEVNGMAVEKGYLVCLLSALPTVLPFTTARPEKEEWSKYYLPGFPLYLSESSEEKSKLCKKGDIIIDDNPRNVAQWMKAGGIAIRHISFKDSLVQLRELL
jgi:hypothetical protein